VIFVTLGSQQFQFNRLLKKIDELIEKGVITEDVYAQTGASDYIPVHYRYKKFLDREEFAEAEEQADVLITHGGTGAIIGAVKKGIKVIAVPRLAKYGEHVDNHQLQIIKEFGEMGLIMACYDVEELEENYRKIGDFQSCPYVSNTDKMIASLEEFLVASGE
jgi:UDP-N-acetylglucosamine transferase subunit ALG13